MAENKNQQLENLLNILDLRGKEREVFSLCFFNGPLPASNIAKQLKINRAAVYQILNQLIEKDVLQKENISGKKQLFNSVSIEEIKEMLSQKQKQMSEIQEQLPELSVSKKVQQDSSSLSVETLSTSLSLRQMLYKAIDNSKSKMYLIASVDDPYNIYGKKFFNSFLKELAKRKITLYTLVPKNNDPAKNNAWSRPSIKVKFLEKSDYPFSNGLLISDKFLFMFSWNPQDQKGLMISDETIRQTYLSLFLLLWEKTIYSDQKNDDSKKVFPANMQLIPGGYFYSGDKTSAKKIFLDSYLIDKTPVTNEEYQKFVKATGYHYPEHWKNGNITKGEEHFPVYNVSWYDAEAYALWAGKRLPTEEEWEKSARGTDKRTYPWGNNFDVNFCNILRKSKGVTPVEKYPLGRSYYGLYDMAGNVWEWTDTKADEKNSYIIKGGSWSDNEKTAQCFYKTSELADKKYDNIGFRCAKDVV
jgi:sugar-specific transcriptional regulator TrmB